MIYLRQGHRSPGVVTAQILLNRHTPSISLGVDGIFGPKTREGVMAFQRYVNSSRRGSLLAVDGIIGKMTWGQLMYLSRMETIDVVDMTAGDLGGAVSDIRLAGGDPIVTYGMSNGVGQAMLSVVQRAGGHDSIALLRLYAHGAPGAINVTAGVEDFDADLAGIALSNFSQIRPSLSMLRGPLAPYASVGFHGCRVGRGPEGRRLVQQLANVWRVPVTAAIQYQYVGGGARYTFRHEGPVVTGFPGGGSLGRWARSVAGHGAMKISPSSR